MVIFSTSIQETKNISLTDGDGDSEQYMGAAEK